jgi:hypothetical protein
MDEFPVARVDDGEDPHHTIHPDALAGTGFRPGMRHLGGGFTVMRFFSAC